MMVSHKKYLLFILVFLVNNFYLPAQIPENYYQGTQELEGDELKTALYNIIKGHVEFPYTSTNTDTWDILKETDKDLSNPDNVILFYTGWSVNGAQEYNNEKGWNREHIWAKSHGDFGTLPGPGTDVHALRPSDISVNSARWNHDFAEGGEIYIDADGETACRYTSNSWEPADEIKGDVARMLFYMATRYEGENGEPDLELVDYVGSSANYEPFHGKLSDLLKWHVEDPVDDWERNRNNIIYSNYQNNRNPFIDHPEFAEKIFRNTVSFIEEKGNFDVKIYPIPAKDNLYIEFPAMDKNSFNLKIFDLKAVKVFEQQLHNDSNYIDCTHFCSGNYILFIFKDKQLVFKKEIVVDK